MRTSILEGKRILMVHQRDWGIKHGFEISKKLYSHGAKLATINFKKSTEYFINNQKEIKFNYILDDTFVEENVENIILKNNYTLNDIKKDYDVHSIWQYASTLRRHSLCYKKKF